MTERINIQNVGAPDPEMRNSDIIDESGADDLDGVDADSVEFAGCIFNDVNYPNGRHVCSGDELLRCDKGNWVRVGSCDQDNP